MKIDRTSFLDTGARTMAPTLLLVSVFLLVVGHDEPGGGFVGGLLAGAALLVVFLTGGRTQVERLLPVAPRALLGAGLAIAVGTALAGVLLGESLLQTGKISLDLGALGGISLGSALVFDIGVYLVVLGLIATVLVHLGDPSEANA